MNWYLNKQELDNIYQTYGEKEQQYKQRREWCKKIRIMGKDLDLTNNLITLTQIIFNRYYLYNSIDSKSISYTIASIFFLCMKLEDCRTQDVNTLKKICCNHFKDIQHFNENELYLYERRLLVGLNFELNIETPHLYFDRFVSLFPLDLSMKMHTTTFINDLCSTHIVLTHSSFTIALLAVCFAAKQNKCNLSYSLDLLITNSTIASLKYPSHWNSEDPSKQIHLSQFFEIKPEYVMEANQALNSFYRK